MLHQDFGHSELGVDTVHSEFVPVLFASGMEQACHYKSLLEASNIPVLLRSERGEEKMYDVFARAIPVLVPDHMHDRASALVAEEERSGATELPCADGTDDDDDKDFEDDLDEDLDEEVDDDEDEEGDEDEDEFDE